MSEIIQYLSFSDWLISLSIMFSRSIYTMEHFLAVKKKEILPFVTAWVDLENM